MTGDLKEQLSPLETIEREELSKAFRDVFATAAGKRVLFWMLEQCAIYQDAYAGDNNATNYTLGRQSVGRRLIGMLDQIDPRLYPKLLLAVADLKLIDRAAAQRGSHQEEEEDEE
jgi:hypothetical protein